MLIYCGIFSEEYDREMMSMLLGNNVQRNCNFTDAKYSHGVPKSTVQSLIINNVDVFERTSKGVPLIKSHYQAHSKLDLSCCFL